MGQNDTDHARGAGLRGQAGQAHRLALQLAALKAHRAGQDMRTIGADLGVGKSTVSRWIAEALEKPDKPSATTDQDMLDAAKRVTRDYRRETHDWIDRVRDSASDLSAPAAANAVLRATELAARVEGLTAPPTAAAVAGSQVAVLLITLHPDRGDVLELRDAMTARLIYSARQFSGEPVHSLNYDRPPVGPVMMQDDLPAVPAILLHPAVISPPTRQPG